MPDGDMVQIHMLTSYPATLLNRDDSGLAKRIPFGGSVRTRVSSQCLKKHWREASAIQSLGVLADRSTRIYEERVAQPLMEHHGASEAEARAVARYLMSKTIDTKASKKDEEHVYSGQVVVLTRAETDFLAEQGARILETVRSEGGDASDPKEVEKLAPIDKEAKKALRLILKALPASLDTAMFGRMVTSDLFARVDAAVSVAHAFTTHGEHAETDYFTAVDTLKGEEDDAGAGHIQDTELTTGVFYLYAVIDMIQLVANLSGDRELADQLATALVRVMATCSPGAKRGSTAPYAYAELVLLERGPDQPRTLANAFRNPIKESGVDLLHESAESLLKHRSKLEEMYGRSAGESCLASIHDVVSNGASAGSLDECLAATFPSEA